LGLPRALARNLRNSFTETALILLIKAEAC
jgi:hypothetical protein